MPTETKKWLTIPKIAAIVALISTLSGMVYAYVVWHFDTFVYQDSMAQYQTKMTQQLESIKVELNDKSTLNYLEVIIILKENELRELDARVDAGEQLTSEEERRRLTLATSVESFKKQRNMLIGLPEALR